jgi:hypothetical protein
MGIDKLLYLMLIVVMYLIVVRFTMWCLRNRSWDEQNIFEEV